MLNKTTTNLRNKMLIGALFLLAFTCFAPLTIIGQIPAPKPCFDFTGSGRTSFATVSGNLQNLIQNPNLGTNQNGNTNLIWRILGNPDRTDQAIPFGLAGADRLTPGYYDNDNRADLSVYRPSEAAYYTRPSGSNVNFQRFQFGLPTDTPGREADYDGDGRDDFTLVRDTGSNLIWYYFRSSNNTLGGVAFGAPGFNNGTGDFPIAGADYNGDGRAEVTVIRSAASGAATYLAGDSVTGAFVAVQQWGNFNTDFFVVGDYMGDRRADFAVYRAFVGGVNGTWYVRENGGNGQVVRPFGFASLSSPTDRPICGDYNGDGKQDIAIYRSSTSTFYWLNSPNFDTFSITPFGQPGDFPVAGLKAF